MNGVDLIAAERQRQIDVEGWTPAHDSSHQEHEMLVAAVCYLAVPGSPWKPLSSSPTPALWPWDTAWWKPSDDPIRNLVKAGALVAAEIDRLQRA